MVKPEAKTLNFWRFFFLLLSLATSAAAGAAAPDSPAAAPDSLPADYIVGPGDTLQVYVWRNPDLTVTLPVRPDGKISTPLVEDMVAVGKSPSTLARDIEGVLSEYVKSPQVNVIVVQPANAYGQIRVIGQVVRPGAVAYREGMTVLDAVLAAGGLGEFAAGNRARVVRTEGDEQQELRVRLDALMNKGDLSQNIPVKPGDVIVVPETRF